MNEGAKKGTSPSKAHLDIGVTRGIETTTNVRGPVTVKEDSVDGDSGSGAHGTTIARLSDVVGEGEGSEVGSSTLNVNSTTSIGCRRDKRSEEEIEKRCRGSYRVPLLESKLELVTEVAELGLLT